MSEKIILGIDPGSNIMGYGIISVKQSKISLIDSGILNLTKEEDHFDKMKIIFHKICSLIELHHVNDVAIEAPFFGKNVQSMLKLGRAQGVAIAAVLSKNIAVTEYSPRKVKQSITGKGSSSKEQVQFMILRLLQLKETPSYFDESDALSIAICHYFQYSNPTSTSETTPKKGTKKGSGWKAFLNQNPDRKL